MKKFFALILMAVIILAMCGCEEDLLLASPNTSPTAGSTTSATTPAETEPSVSIPSHTIPTQTQPVETTTPSAIPTEPVATEPAPSIPGTEPTDPEQTVPETTVHTHTYTATATAPTCTENGYTIHTCACGDSYQDSEVKATGHSYNAQVTAPTCTAKSYTTHTCTCGDSYKDSETPATGHSYTGKVTKEASCTATGVKTYTCKCGDSYTEKIAKLEHSYTAKEFAPTCVEKGYTVHTCSCGDSYKDSYTNATGVHSYGEWTVTTAHSCTQDEISTKSCHCGLSESKVTKYADHSFSEWVVEQEATCVQNQVSARSCTYCNGKEVQVTAPATDAHQFDWVGYCEVCNLKNGHEAPVLEPPVFDVFQGKLGIYEYKNLEQRYWYNDHNPAWIGVFTTEKSANMEAEIKAKFQEHFGYTPNEEVVCTYVGDYFLDGQTTATSVYQYTISDATYTLLECDFYHVYTQLCTDGSGWVGFAVEGNMDTMPTGPEIWDLVEESNQIFMDWTGYDWEYIQANKGEKFWYYMLSEAGTMRTRDGELVEVVFRYIRGINMPVDTPPPID